MTTTRDADRVCESPVFVFSAVRSGSTLLRFILDSHPELACPPETSVSQACKHLANTWNILEYARASDDPNSVDLNIVREHTLAAVREAIDSAFNYYLQSVGKRRWCEKTPDSCFDAELLAQLYPQARFICLYRHCMDVIASMVEARPWGFMRPTYAAEHPGNNVAAGGSYWLANVRRTIAFEKAHPDRCHRVRYEDLITAPEETAAAIFSFLGADQVPGITQTCFQAAHQGNNFGDRKIWFTSAITTESLGRGIQVPTVLLPMQLRKDINRALTELDYRPVDKDWNEALTNIDPRASQGPGPAAAGSIPSRKRPEFEAAVRAITERIQSRSDAELCLIRDRWPSLVGRPGLVIVQAADGNHERLHWRYAFRELAAPPELTGDNQRRRDEAAEPITIVADPVTWLALLGGTANVDSELKAGRLRHVRGSHRGDWDEFYAIAVFLGLAPLPAPAETERAG
jgi:hypothetical protein